MYNPQYTASTIKSRAKSLGITMNELNSRCVINKNTIAMSADSKGGLNAATLNSVADVLQCSVDYLLGRNTPSFSAEHTELIYLFDQLSDSNKEVIAKLLVELGK